jgi:hypothetical protein
VPVGHSFGTFPVRLYASIYPEEVAGILLALAQMSGEFEVLNVIVDLVDKATQQLRKLKPHEIREVIMRYGLDQPRE